MRRRDFIKGIAGSAATAWSLALQAQQGPAMPLIGFLNSASPDTYAPELAGFRQGLHEVGFGGQSLNTIDCRGWPQT